ncbi:MAG: hypothetical protein JXX28_17010 [Deltaproteobacteria bacterium]|nr:hypothetical protein [Deltaproteobacteria bacterium]
MSAALLLVLGCSLPLQVQSRPVGALVELRGAESVVSPGVVRVPWTPLRTQTIKVSAPGYRSLEVPLSRRAMGGGPLRCALEHPVRWVQGAPCGVVSLELVPAHGLSGTWEDAGPR